MQDLKRVSNTAQLCNKSDQVARSWSCAAIRLGLFKEFNMERNHQLNGTE